MLFSTNFKKSKKILLKKLKNSIYRRSNLSKYSKNMCFLAVKIASKMHLNRGELSIKNSGFLFRTWSAQIVQFLYQKKKHIFAIFLKSWIACKCCFQPILKSQKTTYFAIFLTVRQACRAHVLIFTRARGHMCPRALVPTGTCAHGHMCPLPSEYSLG